MLEIKRKAKPGQFRRWRHALKHEDGSAARSVEQLEQSGLEKVTLDGVRPVEAAIRYFRARLPRMEYAAARRAGLPIRSGNVEAMCKSLVTVRMKAAGRPVEAHDGRRGDAAARAAAERPVGIGGSASHRLARSREIANLLDRRGWHEAATAPGSRRRTHGRETRTAPTRIGAVSPPRGSMSQYENHTPDEGCGSNTVTLELR